MPERRNPPRAAAPAPSAPPPPTKLIIRPDPRWSQLPLLKAKLDEFKANVQNSPTIPYDERKKRWETLRNELKSLQAYYDEQQPPNPPVPQNKLKISFRLVYTYNRENVANAPMRQYGRALVGAIDVVTPNTPAEIMALWNGANPPTIATAPANDPVVMAFNKWDSEQYTRTTPVVISDVLVTEQEGAGLLHVPMGKLNMKYASIADIPHSTDNECVLDYILYEFQKPGSRRIKWTRETLKQHLPPSPQGITTQQILTFAENLGDIAVYALDPFMSVFATYKPRNAHVFLFFIVNNSHCFPILDPARRHTIAAANHIKFDDLRTTACYDDAVCDYHIHDDHKVSVLPVDDLCDVAAGLMKQTNHMIERFKFYEHRLTMFQHPTKDCVIVAGSDYQARKNLCDEYFARNKFIDFIWKNQSWGNIAHTIFASQYGDLKRSTYPPALREIYGANTFVPYRMCNDHTATDYTTIDQRRAYTSACVRNDTPYPVFSFADAPEKWDKQHFYAGEYYITRRIVMKPNVLEFPAGVYPLPFVKHAISHGYITPTDVPYVIPARYSLPPDMFKQFATDLYNDHPRDSKNLVNHFIGTCGSLYDRNETAGVSTDAITALATYYNTPNAKINPVGDLYIVRQMKETMRDRGHYPIYRHIIAMSFVALDRMISELNPEQVISINTDCIKVVGSYDASKVKPKSQCGLGDYHVEANTMLTGFPVSSIRDAELALPQTQQIIHLSDDVDYIRNHSCLVVGVGGSGKSHVIAEIATPETIVLTYTNAAANNLRQRGVVAETFDACLFDAKTGEKQPHKLKDKDVIVDEFTLLSPAYMELIYLGRPRRLRMFGDPNQCKAPTDDWLPWHSNPVVLSMCGNTIVHLTYKFKRYDEPLYNALDNLLQTGMFTATQPHADTLFHVCVRNDTRDRLNAQSFDKWRGDREVVVLRGHPSKAPSKGQTPISRVAVGLEVIAYHGHLRHFGIYKTMRFTITAIAEDTITLDDSLVVPIPDFRAVFDYTFALGTYKIQGCELRYTFNVHEAEQMSKNELYTAISRGFSLDAVRVSKVKPQYTPDVPTKCVDLAVRVPAAKTASIYRITCENGMTYVGVTDQTIAARFKQHLARATNARMAEALTPKATIEEIIAVRYSSKKVLLDLEAEYITAEYEAKGDVLNFQHKPKPAKPDTAPPAQRERIRITDNAKDCYYEINVKSAHLTIRKKFYYRATPKEDAYQQADAFRAELLAKYY